MSFIHDKVSANYEQFIKENQTSRLDSPRGALDLLSNDGLFMSYRDQLTDGLNESAKIVVNKVLDRQRELSLNESIQTPNALVYAIHHMKVLTEIYADPVISQVATVIPTDKPIITVPKRYSTASVLNSDGTTTDFRLPRTTELVRANQENLTIALDGTKNDLFALSAGGIVTKDNARINQRYLVITEIVVTDGVLGNITVPIVARPDARGNFNYTFEFDDLDTPSNIVTGELSGNIDPTTGLHHGYATFIGAGGPYSVSSANINVKFSPTSGDIGRVKLNTKMEGYDVNIDIKDEFEIPMLQEAAQDYASIYDIDIIQELSYAIQSQIVLNKDQDIAYFLKLYETEMNKYGAYSQIDLQKYLATNDFKPTNVTDVFKGVVPAISYVSRIIRRNFRAEPQYIVAGLKAAALLENLQSYSVQFPTPNYGESGYVRSEAVDFCKKIVLACDPIPDNRIYLIYKAPSDDLSRTAIADFIHKPLYMKTETTGSIERTFIKTRTTTEFTSTDAMGYIDIQNIGDLI